MRLAPKLLLTCLLAYSTFSFASGETDDGSKPLELPDFSQVHSPANSKKGAQVALTCKTSDGRTLKKDEPGYDSCLSSAQLELTKGSNSSSQTQQSPGAEVNFKFGN